MQPPEHRYHRQEILAQIGKEGQEKLRAARICVIGCGALGTNICQQLARAGIGQLKIIDRDIVEWTNLQRQVLFTEDDARRGLPKALAAKTHISQINSDVKVDPQIVDVDASNIESLVNQVDLILDGTDNVETRYLINDGSVKLKIPWIHGACVGIEGRVMTILPAQSPCLRCVFPDPPKGSELDTCDTAGVLGPAAGVVGALQASQAIQLIVDRPSLQPQLLAIDLWKMRMRTIELSQKKVPDCPSCSHHQFEFLNRLFSQEVATLCGRNAVQVRGVKPVNLGEIAHRLQSSAQIEASKYFVRGVLNGSEGIVMTIFADGRAIVQGIRDLGRARSIYSRFVGN